MALKNKHNTKGNWVKKNKKPIRKNWKKQHSDSEGSDFEVEAASSTQPTIRGFTHNEESDSDSQDTRKLVQQQNRKHKKSGGFQSMGLSPPVFKGVIRKGYQVPTPIQRKTIPLILDGKDVVAMARTGSGKTAAFLLPMYEKLHNHSSAGARALILSPTRELSLQTLKFTKELGKYTGLRSAVILGGDSMDGQFAALHENPDIIIATPGRFMHVLVEMDLKLQSVEYIVFDEADRLFEMGFEEQLTEILQRLPESRQTLLFSATLPKLLVEFAKAGLHDPTLVRLDVDTKLSENLQLAFFQCRSDDKLAILLYLLRRVVKPSEQTVIFAATKHHVEYLQLILQEAGISCSYSYSSLDHTARKINVAKFRAKKTMVLVVTDLAARGIDIPMLDNVINYNFPAKPKLFIHRVGRVARAGRSGIAYNLISPDELPFVFDLHLFLGRSINWAMSGNKSQGDGGLFGRVPQSVVDDEEENVRSWHAKIEISDMKRVITNAYKQYVKSRPAPSSESVKRVKEASTYQIAYHPMFGKVSADVEEARSSLLDSMKTYKPTATIFEINKTKKTDAFSVMKKKRARHEPAIEGATYKRAKLRGEMAQSQQAAEPMASQPLSTNEEMEAAFSSVIAPKRPSGDKLFEPKPKKSKTEPSSVRDEEHYISYQPKDFQSEKGYSLGTSFEKQAAGAILDMTGDDDKHGRKINSALKKWDRKKKKFVGQSGNDKKIKTESGNWISASYKSNMYKDWLQKSKVTNKGEDDDSGDDGEEAMGQGSRGRGSRGGGRRGLGGRSRGGGAMGRGSRGGGSMRGGAGGPRGRGRGRSGHRGDRSPYEGRTHVTRGGRREIKPKEQIVKTRQVKAKKEAYLKHKQSKKPGSGRGKRR